MLSSKHLWVYWMYLLAQLFGSLMALARHCECLCDSLNRIQNNAMLLSALFSTTLVGSVLNAWWGSCLSIHRDCWKLQLMLCLIWRDCFAGLAATVAEPGVAYAPKYSGDLEWWFSSSAESWSTFVLTCIVWCPNRSRVLLQLISNITWTQGWGPAGLLCSKSNTKSKFKSFHHGFVES